MKKQTLLCFALTAVVLFASAAFLPSNESEIYDQVVRLHILANSDSERDQALKVEHLAVHIVAVAQRLAQQPLGFQRLLFGHEDDTVRPVLQRLAQNGEQVGRFPAARAAYDPVQHTRTASFFTNRTIPAT